MNYPCSCCCCLTAAFCVAILTCSMFCVLFLFFAGAVCESILRGRCSPVSGLVDLQTITRRGILYPKKWIIPTMGLCCFLYGVLFTGGWPECLVAMMSGMIIGIMEAYSSVEKQKQQKTTKTIKKQKKTGGRVRGKRMENMR